MGGTKKSKPCGYIKPHKEHVWEEQSPQPNVPHRRKHFCKGIAQEEQKHVHIWDAAKGPIYHEAVLKENASPWQGPFQCSCGMSRWLVDGKVEVRFPIGEPMERIMALRAKLARGKEEWTDEDQAELERIGEALVEALQPLIDALQKIGEQMASYMQSFFDRIDPATLALMAELGKSVGEKPDAVETVDLVTADGTVVDTQIVSYDPIAAVPATALLSDEDQIGVIEEAYDIDSPQMDFIEDGNVYRSLSDGIVQKVGEFVPGNVDVPRGGIAMHISEADLVINLLDETGPSTAHIGLPRAQQFRRASEN